MKRLFQRLTSPLAFLALTLLAGEWALRAIAFEYPPQDDRGPVWTRAEDRAMRDGTSFNHFDAKELWAPRAGARLPWTQDERINAAGYRGPLVQKDRNPGTLRIVTLGSCAAFGRGVPYEDTYSAALERHLRERGVDAQVILGGVTGSTIEQGLERYRAVFRQYAPDLVISSFCGYKEHDPAPRSESDEKRVRAWSSEPARYPCRERSWSPRRNLRLVQIPIYLLAVMRGTHWRERELDFEEGRLRELAQQPWAKLVRRVSLDEFRASLEILEREVRSDGGHLMLVNVPNNLSQAKQSPAVETYGKELSEFGRRTGLFHVDGREVIRRAALQGTPASDLFDTDGFPSSRSHELVAQALSDEIVAHLPELKR
jgi:hypothetical protein